MPFTTPIVISPVREDNIRTIWRVVEPLNFYSENTGKNYVVPKDFETDLASGMLSAAAAAALLHDWLYTNGVFYYQIKDRSEADSVFMEAMVDSGVPLFRAWAYFLSVKLFGAVFYQPKTRR